MRPMAVFDLTRHTDRSMQGMTVGVLRCMSILLARGVGGFLVRQGVSQLLLMKVFECDAPILVGFKGKESKAIQHVVVTRFRFLHDRLQLFLSENASAFLRFLFVRWTRFDRVVRRVTGRRRGRPTRGTRVLARGTGAIRRTSTFMPTRSSIADRFA